MKKKVLFVINTLSHAGAEVAMLELMRNMDPEKYEISCYVLMGQGELVHRLPKHVRLLNNSYSVSSVLSKQGQKNLRRTVLKAAFAHGNLFKNLPYLCSNLTAMIKRGKIWTDKLLWRLMSDGGMELKETYDLAIAYLEGGSAYYVADHVKAAKKAAFIHIDYGKAGYTRRLDRDCYLAFDRVFTVSDEVRDHFLKAYPECEKRTKVFHNLINQEEIVRRSCEEGGFKDSFPGIRLLTVGRLTWQKAYEIAIDAMKLLKEEGWKVRWYVLGEGSEREKLESQIAKLGLEEDFILLGAVPNPYPYYKQCDIYVHGTRFEGKSIAIQEAQTLGCAIIASDCSGNREQIEDGVDGILCDLDAKSIKESILSLIEDEELRKKYGKAAGKKQIVHGEDLEMLFELME